MLSIKELSNGNNEIIVPRGIRYISDWSDYSLYSFPFKHILDKKIPGCGYTEYCLRCNIPIILCSPRKILLENKEMQHQDTVLYFKNELDEDSSVDKDLTKASKDSQSVDEKVDAIKRGQIVERLESQLEIYLEYCVFKQVTPKILVTYDSFRLLRQFLGNRLNNFHIVVDEFQSIFVDSRFKSDTELGFIDQLKDLNRVCYVSATPMIDDYLKLVDEFKDLPYYELNWYAEDPLRVVRPDLDAKVTQSIQSSAAKVIGEYKSGKFETEVTKDGIITSKEAVLYVNSVTNIISIINKCGLTPEECNILCARTASNEMKIKKRLGKDFEIGKVPLKGEPHKMFTFCTRTVYLGADFYSTNARTFIFSDANIDSLAVDITLDLPQILGRQRLSENPWKNRAKLFYKTLRTGNKMTKEEFDEVIKEKEQATEDLLLSYKTSPTSSSKHTLAKEYQYLAKSKNYKDHYVAVNVHGGKDLIPVKNELVKISEQRAYDIQQVAYADRFSVFNTLAEEGQIDEKVSSGVSAFIHQFNSLQNFSSKMRFLCESELTDLEINVILDQIPLQYKNYFLGLGPARCRALGYNVTKISKELSDVIIEQDLDDLSDKIYERFTIGGKYSKSEVKAALGEIYNEIGYNKTPKATDLDEYFVIGNCRLPNSETGKRDAGIEIIKRK